MQLFKALVVAALVLPAFGCSHNQLLPTATVKGQRDWSGIGAMADRKPKPAPKRQAVEAPANFLASAATQAKAPEGFVLTKDTADFRKVEFAQAEKQRRQLAKQVAADAAIMKAFGNWDGQTEQAKLDTLTRVAQIEGRIMGFVPPAMSTKSGVPEGGTLAYFQGDRDGIGKVVLYPQAIAKGDRWAALATVTHEMRHAYQFQLVMKAANKQVAEGTPDMELAYGFYQANMVISKVGGEDKLSYGDYCHLNNEYDAFAVGNQVASIVSQGQANTGGLGFIDVQYRASGDAYAGLDALESKYGAAKLLDAVNQLQLKLIQVAKK